MSFELYEASAPTARKELQDQGLGQVGRFDMPPSGGDIDARFDARLNPSLSASSA